MTDYYVNRRTFLRSVAATSATLGGITAVTGGADADPGHLNEVSGGTLALSGLSWENPAVTYELRVRGATQAMVDGATQAIGQWQHLITEHADTALTAFVEAASRESPDVTIHLKRSSGLIIGQEITLNPDTDGAANRSIVHISGSSAFDGASVETFTRAVTLHELGHSFQLGHYNGPDTADEVMSATIQDPPVVHLSDCDLKAFNAAHDDLPNAPEEESVDC